jgi:hypothetical protein
MAIGTRSGVTPFSLVSAGGANPTFVFDGPCQLFVGQLFNVNAAARFLKVYDVDEEQVGTSGIFQAVAVTPIQFVTPFVNQLPVLNFGIPGNTAGAGSNFGNFPHNAITRGYQFSQGVAIQITANIAVGDQSGITAGDVIVNLGVA